MHFFIEVVHALKSAIQLHPFMSVSCVFVIGLMFGIATYGSTYARKERRLRRLISILQHSFMESIEVWSWGGRIIIHRSKNRALLQASAQGPAAAATTRFSGATVQGEEGKIIYYFPEVATADLPMGIVAEREITLLFGKPPKYRTTLKLTPVIARTAGRWYPAINHNESGLTVLRSALPVRQRKNFWQRGYRNLYVCDYIARGEVLGAISVPGGKAEEVVHAKHSGFIMTFEVQQYTDVVPGANLLFLGTPIDMKILPFDGDRPGYFDYPNGSTSPVGKIITEGSILCTVTSLGLSQEVYMPETGLVVHQYKKVGDTVLYRDENLKKDALFEYIPLTEPLS